MHIPDGFIADPRIWGGCFLITAPVLWWSVRQIGRDTGAQGSVLLPGMTGAFIFAAQMFNFPIVAGTSGHMVGGMLACMLLGAGPGMAIMATVIALQCLLFQDGGVTALGANALNMAVLAGGGGYGLFRLLVSASTPPARRRLVLGCCAAAGVLVSASAVAVEIGAGGIVPIKTALVAMLMVHLPIAAVEGIATVSIIRALEQLRPELVPGLSFDHQHRLVIPLGLAGMALACLAVLFASTSPDGLEHVAQSMGFSAAARPLLRSPLPDYALPGSSGVTGQLGVAMVGLMAVVAVSWMLSLWFRRRRELLDG